MEHLLFAAYLILFAWLTTKVSFFTRSGLTSTQLVIAFLLKVMAGIFYGWVGVYYGQMGQMQDTWAYHYDSFQELALLKEDPLEFFIGLFRPKYESGYGNFFGSKNSWWNDLDVTVIGKCLAFFNLLSFKSYYVNVIFYSFLSLAGPIAFYRVLTDVFHKSKLAVLLSLFLLPSFIYWTSGLHKEGFIFTGLAFVGYAVYFGFKEQAFSLRRWVLVLGGIMLVLMLRNFLIVPLAAALIAWVLAQKLPYKPLHTFAAVYLFFMLLFFSTRFLHPKLDFLKATVAKQEAFLKLTGGSAVPVTPLQPTVGSFLHNAPQAFVNAAIRPFFTDVRHLLSMAAAAEINVLLLLFVLSLFYRRPKQRLNPFLLFCLFFSFSVLLTIGYTVNFLGAIVRYRSIVLPFLVVPMMASIRWSFLNSLLRQNN